MWGSIQAIKPQKFSTRNSKELRAVGFRSPKKVKKRENLLKLRPNDITAWK
jgi:hypothetical protein